MKHRKVLLSIMIAVILLGSIVIGSLLLCSDKTIFYNVTFQDFDKTVLKIESVEVGQAATPPTLQVKMLLLP